MPETRKNGRPTVARVWRGRTLAAVADEYEAYNYEVGIRPLIEKAMGVQTFREDRGEEVEFVTISYWADEASMAQFTCADPRAIHHLPKDADYLVELPKAVQVLKIRHVHGRIGQEETDGGKNG